LLRGAALGASIMTTLYFAPQLGQEKTIGSDVLGTQRAGMCRNMEIAQPMSLRI
jgi:hypothetical protein